MIPSNRYPAVDEVTAGAAALAERWPRHVRLRRIGASRAGDPLRLLTVGHGHRNVLVVAGPHANEPVGGATVLRLARRVAADSRLRDEADTAWHFLLCTDPDGARRNSRWLRGPYHLTHYYRSFYRPGFAEQPEWLSAETALQRLPETQALLDIQDELQPVVQCSLHGVEVGGSFVELTRPLDGLPERIARSAAELDVPMERLAGPRRPVDPGARAGRVPGESGCHRRRAHRWCHQRPARLRDVSPTASPPGRETSTRRLQERVGWMDGLRHIRRLGVPADDQLTLGDHLLDIGPDEVDAKVRAIPLDHCLHHAADRAPCSRR